MARPSHVRTAIARVVQESSRHDWTIEDVAEALRGEGIGADFSSVFRGLSRLADDGELRRVELGDGKARFEAAGEHHEHVRCDRCGAVSAVPGCVVEHVLPDVERETGYSLTGHRLLFSGLCSRCSG